MAIVEDDEKYEQPTLEQKIMAIIIYTLVVGVGFCLLMGLSNYHEPVKSNIKIVNGGEK